MQSNRVSFNFSQARRLIGRIASNRSQFMGVLEELEREVADMPTWWEGNSHARFREMYNCVMSEMPPRLDIMDDTSEYVTKVSNRKDDIEARGKTRF